MHPETQESIYVVCSMVLLSVGTAALLLMLYR